MAPVASDLLLGSFLCATELCASLNHGPILSSSAVGFITLLLSAVISISPSPTTALHSAREWAVLGLCLEIFDALLTRWSHVHVLFHQKPM
jgi:hypothetical protein